MNVRYFLASAAVIAGLVSLSSCNDDVSSIGGSLAGGEVTIMVDSLVTSIDSESVRYDSFDGRNVTKLIGRINVPEYGKLSCSFVSQMMSASRMGVPDSISVNDVDSMRLVFSVPRGSLTGDSLAPQQLTVYRMADQIPSDITSAYDPAGHYDPKPLGIRTYTLSNIAKGDSAMKRDAYVKIPVTIPVEFARDLFNRYRASDPIFEWPATFNTFFPGIYVEQNFGNGCIANISKAEFFTYWHYTRMINEMMPDSTVQKVPHVYRDSVCLMASQPEVISSNIISYEVSDRITGMADAGKPVITTPGGYMVGIRFPVRTLLDRYHSKQGALSIVSGLRFEIPAYAIDNDYGLTVAPNLLMVKKSDYEDFFANNKVPDNVSSFLASYDAEAGSYTFSAMRMWLLNLLNDEEKGNELNDEDFEFLLVPVDVKKEDVTNYSGTVTSYVTRCQPYLSKPTMTGLHTDRALIVFTYSSQQIE